MPSGAKKRKAAKKKKEKQSTTPASVPHGDGELKPHDEKESEGEEEEVEKREDCSSNSKNDGEKVASEEKSISENEREMKPEGESKSRNVKIESAEHDSSSISSSGSSSDDESYKKKTVVMEAAPLELVSEVTDIQVQEAVETVPVLDLDKSSFQEQAVNVIENISADYSKSSEAIESESKENKEKKLPSGEVFEGISKVTNPGSQSTEAEVSATSVAIAVASSEAERYTPLDASNASAYVTGSEFPVSSDNQPLIASAPQPVRKTPWKSCCGLFEVFSSSNR